MGYLWAWLLEAEKSLGKSCGLGGVLHCKFVRDFPTRLAGRLQFKTLESSAEICVLERKPNVPVADAPPADVAEPIQIG